MIRQQQHDRIRVISIDRPNLRNAVNPDTAQALYAAFVDFEQCRESQVAILTGAEGHFCAGYDLKAFTADKTDWLHQLHWGEQGAPPLGPMGPSRLALSKPVIAAIEGAAVAGGMELALWCDLRVMAQDAYMGVYCRRWGVPLIDGGTVRLPKLIGLSRAQELILTGRKVDATECQQIGLANRLAEPGSALEVAMALAEELLRFPQACMNADRIAARGDELTALQREFDCGEHVVLDALAGATRFVQGEGRHGRLT